MGHHVSKWPGALESGRCINGSGLFPPFQMHGEGSELHELGGVKGHAGTPRKCLEDPSPRESCIKQSQSSHSLDDIAKECSGPSAREAGHDKVPTCGGRLVSISLLTTHLGGSQEAGGQIQASLQNESSGKAVGGGGITPSGLSRSSPPQLTCLPVITLSF